MVHAINKDVKTVIQDMNKYSHSAGKCLSNHSSKIMISGTTVTNHYIDFIMTTMASQITSLILVYSTVYSDADQRKHQSSASLAFVWGIHRDRWIPHTKDQLRGKCFHLMTSSRWIDFVWEWICNFISYVILGHYLSRPRFKLILISKPLRWC